MATGSRACDAQKEVLHHKKRRSKRDVETRPAYAVFGFSDGEDSFDAAAPNGMRRTSRGCRSPVATLYTSPTHNATPSTAMTLAERVDRCVVPMASRMLLEAAGVRENRMGPSDGPGAVLKWRQDEVIKK